MGTVTPLPFGNRAVPQQTGFERPELMRILDLYGRMVAAGHWRDYAMDFHRAAAIFSAFRRAAERPSYRIEKRPALRSPPSMWALVSEDRSDKRRAGNECVGRWILRWTKYTIKKK